MKVQISNLFCYGQVDIDLPEGKPLLVTGPNSAGKTSFARILGALVSHTDNPANLSVAHNKSYVRDGAPEGYAALGDLVWTPPSGMNIPKGQTPASLPHCVGLVNFLAHHTRKGDRSKIWEGLFLPNDPKGILEPHWQQTEQQLANVLDLIISEGWEKAASTYNSQKLQYRRQWENVTGERFGVKKASEWIPAQWSVELDGVSEDDCINEISEASEALRLLTTSQAVSQQKIDDGLHARNVMIPDVHQQIADLKDKLDKFMFSYNRAETDYQDKFKSRQALVNEMSDLQLEGTKLQGAIEKLKEPEPDFSCPHCDKEISMTNGKPEKFVSKDFGEEREKLTQELAGVGTKFNKKKAEFEKDVVFKDAKTLWDQACKDKSLKEAEINRLEGQLEALEKTAAFADRESNTISEAERSQCENNLATAKKKFEVWKQRRDADKAYENFVEYDTIAKLLEPDGARGEHMQKNMNVVRTCLQAITTRTGWKPITITRTYETLSNNRPAQLCAANEQAKIQWALQISCFAMKSKLSNWLIIDAADLLRGESWDGLIMQINKLHEKFPQKMLVVCGTQLETPAGWNCVNLTELDGNV